MLAKKVCMHKIYYGLSIIFVSSLSANYPGILKKKKKKQPLPLLLFRVRTRKTHTAKHSLHLKVLKEGCKQWAKCCHFRKTEVSGFFLCVRDYFT